MKMKKKTVKGMTLIEIIISLLIFTLMASIMVRVGSLTKSLMMNTNHLNNKTTAESPIGAVQDVAGLEDTVIALNPAADQAAVDAATGKTPVTITVKGSGFTTTLNASRYSTQAAAAASDRNCDTSNHMNGDLQFYVIEP